MVRRIPSLVLCLATLSALFAAGLETYTAAERRHWAFQKRQRPEPPTPAAADAAWIKNPIDAFVIAKLRKEGLAPAPKADRATLIRRVTFDLTGLPPTPAEVTAFVTDKRPDAYEKLIDRLLASPQYGERWGQHWLDVVRFSETDGYEYDAHRRDAWRYRDYVIHSFNTDKPYNQFIREQLAGDELAPNNEIMRVASGFQRLGPLRKNAGNQEVASSRNEQLTEMTNVVGSAIMGVTLGCARCHDHKFDPIRHTDYYRIQAYFSGTFEEDVPLSSKEEQAAWKVKKDAWDSEMKQMKEAMKKLEGDAKLQMEKKLKDMEALAPAPLPSLYSVRTDMGKASPIHVLARGDYQNKGEKVGMRPLGVLLPDGTPEVTPEKPRTALADWILQDEHPLTARVMANRVWLGHFGRGIVNTPNDFGRMGQRPSHPELLDFLANSLVENGWKLKPLHKLILLSNTYQQSSQSPIAKAAYEKDPENKLLWKFSRRRLEAEEIRDSMLAVAGALNLKAGGPGVIVPVDQTLVDLLYKPSQWAVDKDPNEHNRRSVYLIAKRNLRLPFMEVFDAPDMQLSCPRRESSTHAPQALELLNGDTSNRMAEALAARLEKEAPKQPAKQVDLAFRLATGKAPNPAQKQAALAFLKQQPLREFTLAVLNLNQFLYID
jgi:hypothetical protein